MIRVMGKELVREKGRLLSKSEGGKSEGRENRPESSLGRSACEGSHGEWTWGGRGSMCPKGREKQKEKRRAHISFHGLLHFLNGMLKLN